MLTVTPRGLLAGAFALVVAAVCVRLGFWQLDRLHQRRARNAELAAALALPPLELRGDSLAAAMRRPAAYRYRRVRARGAYDPAGELLLRGRALEGRPGVHVVTPLRLAGDTAVLVLRGWLPASDAATVDPRPFAEPGERVVEGVLLAPEEARRGGVPHPETVGGARISTYQRIDLAALRHTLRYPLLPLYLQQLPQPEPAGAAAPRRVPLPPQGEGPHLGYAIQWFGFAAVAVVGMLVVALRQRRPTD